VAGDGHRRRGRRALLRLPEPQHVEKAEDEQRDDGDESQRVAPAMGMRPAEGRVAAEGFVLLVGLEARAIFVEHDVGVEAKVGGVGTQEALDVGRRRHEVEVVVFHRLDVLDTDLRVVFGLLERRLAPDPGLAQGASDLKHATLFSSLVDAGTS
jgi:hypothetical protein